MRFDVVIIGGGLAGISAGLRLQEAGKNTVVVSSGLSLHDTPRAEYAAKGGVILAGDTVVGGCIENGVLKYVRTHNLGATLLYADNFILCTGKFFSKGIVSTMDKVYEPVFGCDVQYEKDSSKWVTGSFADVQPFMSFGVITDGEGRVSVKGETVANLYAAGEILAGSNVNIEESVSEVCRRLI